MSHYRTPRHLTLSSHVHVTLAQVKTMRGEKVLLPITIHLHPESALSPYIFMLVFDEFCGQYTRINIMVHLFVDQVVSIDF